MRRSFPVFRPSTRLSDPTHRNAARTLLGLTAAALLLSACGGVRPDPKPGIMPKLGYPGQTPFAAQLKACQQETDRAGIHNRRQSFQSYVAAITEVARACGVSEDTLKNRAAAIVRTPRVLRFYGQAAQPKIEQFASRELAQRRRRVHAVEHFINNNLDYLIRKGVEKYQQHRQLVERVADRYGVAAPYLMAIWGIETLYGQNAGSFDVLNSLATLGHGFRRAGVRLYFTKELIAALILIDKKVPPTDWVGSFAGASGMPQFMPSDVIRFGASWSRTAVPNIWRVDRPEDVFASIANFLREKASWDPSIDRAIVEVRLNRQRFRFERANRFRDWQPSIDFVRMGVRDAAGRGLLYRWNQSTVYLPAGCYGPAFLTNPNFTAILVYNRSFNYALKVAILAEALRSTLAGEGFRLHGSWPDGRQRLHRGEVRRLQAALNRAGMRGQDGAPLRLDGLQGSNMRTPVRRMQLRHGFCPDGIAKLQLYRKLVKVKRRKLRKRRRYRRRIRRRRALSALPFSVRGERPAYTVPSVKAPQ